VETEKVFISCRSTCARKRPQVLPATRSLTLPAAHCACINQTTPFLANKRLTLFPLNVRFSSDPRSCTWPKARCSLCAYKPNDPVSCEQKAHAFSAQRAFFKRPQVLHAAKSSLLTVCVQTNDPVSCGQKAHAFSAQRAFRTRSWILPMV
jgi:hypothetical protein